MSVPAGHVYVDLLQVLREQDDIIANEAANEIERLRQSRNAIIEECVRKLEWLMDQEDIDVAKWPDAIRALNRKPWHLILRIRQYRSNGP